MLIIEISKKKPKPAVFSYSTTYPNKAPSLLLIEEYQRRDKVIKDLIKNCKYKVGEVVTPSDPNNASKYGTNITVTRFVEKYSQMGGTEVWPKDDNPMIVEAVGEDGVMFWCTTNYLKAK